MENGMSERARGTGWRIWDLHVHTPASIVHNYHCRDTDVWEKYIEDLENLPSDIKVIGINDYWFLDGYRKVIKARAEGRLQNLEAIFPVVEMRLRHFGGTSGNLSRVNLHVIFDPELTPDLIEAQFINALQPNMKLEPGHDGISWGGVITKESLTDLGKKIKETVPEDQKSNYGKDIIEGFNNLTVGLDDVKKLLGSSYFRGHAIIGIGKTEWRDIKWNNQSIAAKKDVINSASLVFTAYATASNWEKDVDDLRNSGVTHQLLDCSDAHAFSDSGESMRLGACQTWMNTIPTFAGLLYALEEFERRVYVGLEPPMLRRIQTAPDRFIDRVQVYSEKEGYRLFQHDLPLNPGFVAVVGNKGQGKSALLDCIALGGNSSRDDEFAFLTRSRFLSPQNLKTAKAYETHIRWLDGGEDARALDSGNESSARVRVEYLPQAFVERVCNNDPSTTESDEFEQELRAILFTHIPEQDRLGERTFDDLLRRKTESSDNEISRLRADLDLLVRNYLDIAEFRGKNPVSDVEGRLREKRNEIDAARQDLSDAEQFFSQIDAENAEDGDHVALMQKAEEIESKIRVLKERINSHAASHKVLRTQVTKVEDIVSHARLLQREVETLNADVLQIVCETPCDPPLIEVVVDDRRLDAWLDNKRAELSRLEEERFQSEAEVSDLEMQKEENVNKLASANLGLERARQRIIQLRSRVDSLIGSGDDDQSETGLKELLERVQDAPVKMNECHEVIIEKSRQIFSLLHSRIAEVESLYAPASAFIESSSAVKNAGLKFNAELRLRPIWGELATALDSRRNGEFLDWLDSVPDRLFVVSWECVQPQLLELFKRIETERGETEGNYRDPATAFRKVFTPQEFFMKVFDLSWLEVRFGLTGDNRQLSQLSPGQRGLVLALFYLVVDRRDTPLLLDQPEENLDNETIASKLVPAIHEAAGRRQTIVVTHNANLAIVGDADQIVHCQMRDDCFSVSSGSIAELDVARFALDVLEGTKPAFDNRRQKYEAFPELA